MTSTEKTVWEGAQALRQYLVPVDHLAESEENARKGDVMALVGSLKRFGQVRPIAVVQELGGFRIVAGHHLRLAAMELGWTHVAAIPNEFSSDEERVAYLIADNQLSSLGGYDEQKRLEQMSFLDELASQGNLEGTGFTMDSLEDTRAALGGVATTDAPEVLTRGSSEDAQAAAERAAQLASSRAMKEVVLMMDPEQYEEFGRYVRVLQKSYRTEEAPNPGIVVTVLRAVGERVTEIGLPE